MPEMSKKLKVAVIGVGSLGQHHARNYSNMQNVELVAIVDKNIEQAQKVADKLAAARELRDKKQSAILNILHRLFGLSFLRKQESKKERKTWIPAFAGNDTRKVE